MTLQRVNQLDAHAERDIRRRIIDITLTYSRPDGGMAFVSPPNVVSYTSEELASCPGISPTLSMSPEEAERLMNALWHARIRPTEMPESSAGEIEALKSVRANLLAEIDFLRQLVKHHLGMV